MSSFFNYIKSFFNDSTGVEPLEGLNGLARCEAILHNLEVEERVPGLAIKVFKDGKSQIHRGVGYANLENKTPVHVDNTIFRIASISKCITGLTLGKMVEEGVVDFDDSFYKHVPYFPKKKYDFTLRQLASHTAGIRGYRGKEFGMNRPYSIKESIAVFKDSPLVFEPGKGYLYNSFDFVLLSLAMQEASGIPYEMYVKEKVLDPLGMTNTVTPKDLLPLLHKNVSISEFYTKRPHGFKKAIEVNNFYKLAGGGYLSTCNDITILGQAILEQKLLKPKTYQELLTSIKVNAKPTYYGLGFQVSQDKKSRPFVGHVGSSVGAYSNLFVYPNEKMVVSILTNCTDAGIQDILDEVILSLGSIN